MVKMRTKGGGPGPLLGRRRRGIPRGHGELPQDDGGLPLLPQGHSGLPQDPFIASTTFRIGTCSGSGA